MDEVLWRVDKWTLGAVRDNLMEHTQENKEFMRQIDKLKVEEAFMTLQSIIKVIPSIFDINWILIRKEKGLYMIFIDIEKAYDKATREVQRFVT